MTKISEILGLNADNQRTKTPKAAPQTAQNAQNTATSASNSASQPQNDGSAESGPRSLVTIPSENRASDTTRFEVTDQKDKDGKVVTPAQDIRIGHLNTMPNPANTAEDRARLNDERLLQIAQDNERLKQARQAQANPKHLTYAEMLDKLYPEQAEARRKADEERTARRRKRDAVISALGDGLTTIANLGSVIGGANPVQQDSMSERTQQRYDKLKADADARRDAYRAARFRALQADQEREDALAAAERAVKQHDEDARRESAYKLAALNTQREIAGLRTQTQKEIAEGNWAARKYATDKSYDGRIYAANHKSSSKSGGAKYGYEWVEQYSPLTGKNEWHYVSGNEALKHYRSMEGQDNYTDKPDGSGGTQRETKVNGNAKANAQHTKDNHNKSKGAIPGTRQAKNNSNAQGGKGKTQVGPK